MNFAATGCTVIFFTMMARHACATGVHLNEVEVDFGGCDETTELQKQRLTKENNIQIFGVKS